MARHKSLKTKELQKPCFEPIPITKKEKEIEPMLKGYILETPKKDKRLW